MNFLSDSSNKISEGKNHTGSKQVTLDKLRRAKRELLSSLQRNHSVRENENDLVDLSINRLSEREGRKTR